MKLLATITISNYPRKIMTSKSARPVYWILDEDGIIRSQKKRTLPKKYLLKEFKVVNKYAKPGMLKEPYAMYAMGSKEKILGRYNPITKSIDWLGEPAKKYKIVLVDTTLPEVIYANPKIAGKSRYYNIKGNDIYSGNIHPFTRVKVMEKLHATFEAAIAKQCPVIKDYPIKIECVLYDYFDDAQANGQDWDIDNRVYIYNKAFLDSLTSVGKIVDDNRLYIVGSPGCVFIPISSTETPRLEYKVYTVDYSQYAEYKARLSPLTFNPNKNDGRNDLPY